MANLVFKTNFGSGKDQILAGTDFVASKHGNEKALTERGILISAEEYHANNKPSVSKEELLKNRIKELEAENTKLKADAKKGAK
jgi:hypothetical protein